MSNDNSEQDLLSKVYAQIVRGYTTTTYQKQQVFIRHFGVEEQFLIQLKYDQVLENASRQGLPTRKEALAALEKEGTWTKAEETKLEQQQQYLDGLRNSRKHLIIPSQVKQLSTQIEEATEELQKQERVREALLLNTCEHFADLRANDYSVYLSFCSNESLKPLFSQEEFDEIDKVELMELVGLYNECMSALGTDTIKKIAIAPFFVNYFSLTGDAPYTFFDKAISSLTYYQVNLLSYGRVFKSIFENIADIPDHIKDDPDKILDHAESSKKTAASRDKAEKADGYSVVGANEGDLTSMGIKDSTTKSIFDLAAEKGGNLSMTDFK